MSSSVDFIHRRRVGANIDSLPLDSWPPERTTPDPPTRLPVKRAATKVVLVNGEQLIVDGDVTDVWQRLAKERAGEELFFSECFSMAASTRQVVIARDKVLYLEAHDA